MNIYLISAAERHSSSHTSTERQVSAARFNKAILPARRITQWQFILIRLNRGGNMRAGEPFGFVAVREIPSGGVNLLPVAIKYDII